MKLEIAGVTITEVNENKFVVKGVPYDKSDRYINLNLTARKLDLWATENLTKPHAKRIQQYFMLVKGGK